MFQVKSFSTRVFWCLTLFFTFGLFACGQKEKNESESQEQQSPVVSSGQAPTVGAIALVATPLEAIDLMDGALSSAMSVGGGVLRSDSSVGLRLSSDGGITCSASGLPIAPNAARNVAKDGKSGENVLPDSDAEFAIGSFYCMIASDTGDSGSIQGAIGEAKLIACMVGDSIVFDGAEHSFDVVVEGNPCFGGEVPEGISSATFTVKSTASEPASTGGAGWGFDAHLSLNVGDESLGIDLLGTFTNQLVALTVRGGGTATDAFSFVLDRQEGSVRYEGRYQRFEKSGWADHTRLLLKGTLDQNMQFTDLNSIEGAASSIYGVNGGTGENNDSTEIKSAILMTAKGNRIDGVRTYSYKCSSESDECSQDGLTSWIPVDGTGHCYGGACEGNVGIQLQVNSDLGFMMRPASYQSVTDWYNSMSPLSFVEVTLDETQ